ncbi:DUF6042 family protein [Paramaledivibacter caminithermalis]|jgi:hypothetical protein|uniref:Uncharacterized protein n=1 Tax=Paramaledivibacter caminithermalis (strain DSM 15212 / CIP 107654 / DViRD3) TaxID=1121301 RepID=A0A1M6KEK4_PARC5|nr:DUF6042 family protein [Paramaledivibacter caminithermalis]SHJ57353.1 hypothetical protein SAMN02745912_00358 [Paramaledivibacter caminithermalis DSM 15212]
MEKKGTIHMPKEIHEYLWLRYLPETTYKMYIMIGYLQTEKIRGDEATKKLLGANLKEENAIPKVIEEKKRLLKSLGFKYPENRQDDLKLLLDFNLIKIGKDKEDNVVYVYNIPVPKPQDILKLNEEELQTLENIKFEIKYQNAFNMILTLLINNNGNLMSTLEHIQTTTKVKLTDIKLVLEYLVKEGSISVRTQKDISKLKKADKIFIKINEDVFEEKRLVL